MSTNEEPMRTESGAEIRRDLEGEGHATTGGAAAAGAVTGGVIGLAAGPVGAALGVVGGAIVGAVTEGIMHAGRDRDVVARAGGESVWDDEMPRYRADWERRHGATDERWETYEPHYRYGWEISNDARYRARAFEDAEPDLRRDWDARYPDTPWDEAREPIRRAWERRVRDGD